MTITVSQFDKANSHLLAAERELNKIRAGRFNLDSETRAAVNAAIDAVLLAQAKLSDQPQAEDKHT